jgi:hypothetical protein
MINYTTNGTRSSASALPMITSPEELAVNHKHYNKKEVQLSPTTPSSSHQLIPQSPRTPYTPQTPNTPQRGRRGKKMIPLTEEQLKSMYMYPQPEAAKRLGVSLSTLKRRFYELHNGQRWPYNDIKKILKRRKLKYILNDRNKPTKYLDQMTIHCLQKAFTSHVY